MHEGGPAFPIKDFDQTEWKGMTLRDYFAAKAMAALLLIGTTRPKPTSRNDGTEFDEPDQPWYFGSWEETPDGGGVEALTGDAYYVADAMLKSRELP